eukprot:m.333903 g.333903  ORF g.333903 m.333903 type:complete len:310 (-) comp17243_c0_seq1:4363-5292(-)
MANRVEGTVEKTPLHHHELFPNMSLYCSGRCISAKDKFGLIFTGGLIILWTVLFHVFTGPYLWRELNPVVPLATGYLSILLLVFFLLTALTDPGIIPRAPKEEAQLSTPRKPHSVHHPPWSQDAMVMGKEVNLKYCTTCHLYRPPRASHCRICNNCVENFDHHCPWVSNCIGRRNYRFFIAFVSLLCIIVITFFSFSLFQLIHLQTSGEADSIGSALKRVPIAGATMIMCFCTIWSVGGLWCFHFFLIANGQTTYEHIRRTYLTAYDNPYNRGSCNNWLFVCFSPRPPSLIRLRDPYTDNKFMAELEDV